MALLTAKEKLNTEAAEASQRTQRGFAATKVEFSVTSVPRSL